MVDWVQKCRQLGVEIKADPSGHYPRYILVFPSGYCVWCHEDHQVAEELEEWRSASS